MGVVSLAMAEDDPWPFVLQSLAKIVCEICGMVDGRKVMIRDCGKLSRRVKLLAPLFEELREMKHPYPSSPSLLTSLQSLCGVLEEARDLLRRCYEGSKLYLVLENEGFARTFHSITMKLGKALDDLSYGQLKLSDEVHEQVELLHSQLRRAKAGPDSHDHELYSNAMTILFQKGKNEIDESLLKKFGSKVQLQTESELWQECRALHCLIMDKDGNFDHHLEHISWLLCKLKSIAAGDCEGADSRKVATSNGFERSILPDIPDDFRCPISLELMEDPVIVATGQTYERAYIQQWFDAGRKTCPKTQQVLPHMILTPNYVLRSLIRQWCENHGIEMPRKSKSPSRFFHRSREIHLQVSSADRATVDDLIQKLCDVELDVQRAAAGELRLLAKRSVENRVCIAEAGAIPLLVDLLSTTDTILQEHAVTSLLNLSIREANKEMIVSAGAIAPIVEVLQHGSMTGRENAAATLFSLSLVDENKVTIGATSGAIPALVELLCDGSLRGKKDAATALFNLSIFQGNKARAIRAGVIPPLMQLLANSSTGMVDEALAVVAILATHQDGRVAIGSTEPVPILVGLIRFGSPRNKENAAAVLLSLSTADTVHLAEARKHGAYVPLAGLARSGTARARRKATALLEYMMNVQAE